jgi:hypothetical protein
MAIIIKKKIKILNESEKIREKKEREREKAN